MSTRTQHSTVTPAPFGGTVGARLLQRRCAPAAAGIQGGLAVPSSVHQVLRSGGQPLSPATRAFMEPRFGHDFSGVRIHDDARAAESAGDVNALAYTVGNHVAFGAGRYAPDAPGGRRLLAHELAHVVQQAGSGTGLQPMPDTVSRQDEPAEAAAERAADTVVGAGPVEAARPVLGTEGLRLQRKDADDLSSLRLTTPSLISSDLDLTVDRFATNSAQLSSEQKGQLAAFAQVILANLPDYGDSFVSVSGHTDAVGSEALNQALGQQRADVTRDFLIAQKVPAGIVSAISMGKSLLKVPTQSAEGRNRRAEISVTLRSKLGGRAGGGGHRTLHFPLPDVSLDGTATLTKDPEPPKKPPVKQETDSEEPPDPRGTEKKEEEEKAHIGVQGGTGVQTNLRSPRQPFAYAQLTLEYSDLYAKSFKREDLPSWMAKHVSSLKFLGEPGLTLQFHYLGDSVASFDLQFLFKLIQASVDKVGDVSLVAGAGYNDIFKKPDPIRLTPLVGLEGERKLGKLGGGEVSVVLDLLLGAQNIDKPNVPPPPAGTDAEQIRQMNVQLSGELRLSF